MATRAGSLGRVNLAEVPDVGASLQKLTVYEHAYSEVAGTGVFRTQAPCYQVEMPDDLHSIDDNQLGDLLFKLANVTTDVDELLTRYKLERNEAEVRLELAKADTRIHVPEDLKVQDKNDLVIVNGRVVEAQGKFLLADAKYEITKVFRDGFQKKWETVSRRITQRGQEVDRGRRETNVVGVRNHNPVSFRRPGGGG